MSERLKRKELTSGSRKIEMTDSSQLSTEIFRHSSKKTILAPFVHTFTKIKRYERIRKSLESRHQCLNTET